MIERLLNLFGYVKREANRAKIDESIDIALLHGYQVRKYLSCLDPKDRGNFELMCVLDYLASNGDVLFDGNWDMLGTTTEGMTKKQIEVRERRSNIRIVK